MNKDCCSKSRRHGANWQRPARSRRRLSRLNLRNRGGVQINATTEFKARLQNTRWSVSEVWLAGAVSWRAVRVRSPAHRPRMQARPLVCVALAELCFLRLIYILLCGLAQIPNLKAPQSCCGTCATRLTAGRFCFPITAASPQMPLIERSAAEYTRDILKPGNKVGLTGICAASSTNAKPAQGSQQMSRTALPVRVEIIPC